MCHLLEYHSDQSMLQHSLPATHLTKVVENKKVGIWVISKVTWVYFTLSCSSLFVIEAKTEFSVPQLNAASSQFFSSVEIFQHFPPTYESFTSFYVQWYRQLDKVLLSFWLTFWFALCTFVHPLSHIVLSNTRPLLQCWGFASWKMSSSSQNQNP